MRRRFKESMMQDMYDHCRILGSDLSSSLFHQGWPRRGAGHRAAYWNGRQGLVNRTSPRNSVSYAAWAAGTDDLRAGLAYPTRPSRPRVATP